MERVRRERPDLPEAELRRHHQPFRASIASTERRYDGDLARVRPRTSSSASNTNWAAFSDRPQTS